MKSFLLVFLAVLFVSSVCAEDIVTPDGYLGRLGIEIWSGWNFKQGFTYSPTGDFFELNDWSAGISLMKPLARFSTIYLTGNFNKIGQPEFFQQWRLSSELSFKTGFKIYIK